eukprot:3695437-Rhodomonas_salina.2
MALAGARERDEATQILERVAEELGEAAEEEEGGEKREGAQRGLWQVLCARGGVEEEGGSIPLSYYAMAGTDS